MKYILFSFFAISVFLSCTKDNDNNTQVINTQTPASLQSKTWLLDSFITVTPDYSVTTYTDVNEEQTIVFGKDTLVKSTGTYRVTYNTSYDGSSIIYYWLPGTTNTKDMYWQIVSTTDSSLITKEFPQVDKTVTSYYQVK